MVRDTIKGISIQTPKSLISSFCPCESIIENNSYKNSDLFQPQTNKKYVIKDDYKFQTISTNEKDNNKNNPFIIYVCDNVQKINFNENQNQYQNQVINTDTNIKKTEHKKNDKNEKNKNQKVTFNKYNQINNNKSINMDKEKEYLQRKSIDPKIKTNKYGNDVKNVFMSGNKKNMKIQRISTDIRERIKSGKYKSLTGVKNCRNIIRDSNVISHTNIKTGNNNTNAKAQLEKSIESHNNGNDKYRLSKTSDISIRKKQKTENYNKAMLINRVNMKKDINNPFYKAES